MGCAAANLFFDPFVKLAFWLAQGELCLRQPLGSVTFLSHVIKLWNKQLAFQKPGTVGTVLLTTRPVRTHTQPHSLGGVLTQLVHQMLEAVQKGKQSGRREGVCGTLGSNYLLRTEMPLSAAMWPSSGKLLTRNMMWQVIIILLRNFMKSLLIQIKK